MADPTIDLVTPERYRVAFTPGSISGVVTARGRYWCDGHLSDRHKVEVGQRYVANALPPDHPDIGNPGWLHMRICLDCCPVEYDERREPPSATEEADRG